MFFSFCLSIGNSDKQAGNLIVTINGTISKKYANIDHISEAVADIDSGYIAGSFDIGNSTGGGEYVDSCGHVIEGGIRPPLIMSRKKQQKSMQVLRWQMPEQEYQLSRY